MGGRSFGPLRFSGHLLTVGPVTAIRFSYLRTALAGMAAQEAARGASTPEEAERLAEDARTRADKDIYAAFLASALAMPLSIAQLLAGLLVEDAIPPKVLQRITMDDLLHLWAAFTEINDLPFLEGKDRPAVGGDALPLEDLAFILCRSSQGAYSVHELLVELPYQEFLELAESERRVGEMAETGTHPCHKDVTDEDLAWFKEHHPEGFQDLEPENAPEPPNA